MLLIKSSPMKTLWVIEDRQYLHKKAKVEMIYTSLSKYTFFFTLKCLNRLKLKQKKKEKGKKGKSYSTAVVVQVSKCVSPELTRDTRINK